MNLFDIDREFSWKISGEFDATLAEIKIKYDLNYLSYIRYYPDKIMPLFNDPSCVEQCLSSSSYIPPGWLLARRQAFVG